LAQRSLNSVGYVWRGLATSQRDIFAENDVDGSAGVRHVR
jgi:hypothetical protein